MSPSLEPEPEPEPEPVQPPHRSVSFSGADQLRHQTPELVGTRSSRYDIRARRKAAELRTSSNREQQLQRLARASSDERLVDGPGAKEWWRRQQWSVGNERQASQQAWRVERRESKLRPLASQPPFGKSAAAFSLDPIFDAECRSKVDTLSRELGTSESFAATLIHRRRRRNSGRKLQLAPTKSLPDLGTEGGQGLRFIEAVNAIRTQLDLGKDLTPQEVVRQGCVELGVEWRPEAATLKHGTALLCEQLDIVTGWSETEMRTVQVSEVHPSWVAAPSAQPYGSATSLASASSDKSEKLQRLRHEAQEAVGSYSLAKSQAKIAVGSYAKAATKKIKREKARELGLSHEQAVDLEFGSGTSVGTSVATPDKRRRSGSAAATPSQPAQTGGGPQWIDGFAEALDQAATGDRPVFVTTRPEKLKGVNNPSAGESFAFRPSFILPQTRVLIKKTGGPIEEEVQDAFSPLSRR